MDQPAGAVPHKKKHVTFLKVLTWLGFVIGQSRDADFVFGERGGIVFCFQLADVGSAAEHIEYFLVRKPNQQRLNTRQNSPMHLFQSVVASS